MGFSGGSSNVTKAHTHSSSIVQDGGALNFSNVTQAGMAAGDITYSNGTALQVLGLGSATDTLTVNAGATAPEWAAAGGATFANDNATLGASDFTTTSASLVDITGLEIDLSTIAGGFSVIVGTLTTTRSGAGGTMYALADDGSVIASSFTAHEKASGSDLSPIPLSHIMSSDGSQIFAQAATGGATLTIAGTAEWTSSINSVSMG